VKFRCERDVLTDALGTCGRAVGARSSSLPVLAGIQLQLTGDTLRLTGTDLELAITIDLDVAGAEDGTVVIPARLLNDIVRSLPAGALTVEGHDDSADIAAGRSQFNLRLIPAEEFPRPAPPAAEPVTIPGKEFAQALRQVVPAASSDDSRPILTGVLLTAEGEGVRLVATDSYRLSLRDLPGTAVLATGHHVLLPSRALGELARLLGSGQATDEVALRLGERDASFEVGRARLTTRLIEGEFPNYAGLIPRSHPNRLYVSREVLVEAVRRVRLLARESTPVRLVMRSDGLDLMAVTQDVGQAHESLDARYEGNELTVAFNPDYLLDGLEATPDDEVVLHTLDGRNPAVLRGRNNDEFLYLLMPVRVS
jgi:DNA polymerase-3 subunit beta